jgi:pilus assembly protein CpaB
LRPVNDNGQLPNPMKLLTPARVTLLMLLIVGGLVAAYVAKNLAGADEKPSTIPTRTVPMAISDLKPGTVVTDAHLGVGRMAVAELGEHPGMLLESRAIVGRVVKQEIQAGTPITSDQLYQPGELPPLSVTKGMRAVSVPLKDAVALVDGRITPGQFVDVHLTPAVDTANRARFRGGITITLFKGVRVLAMSTGGGRALGRGPGSSVTLELTPGQANIMILASARGEITLSYNPDGPGNGGVGVNREDRATLDEILGLSTPRDDSFTAESYKGTTRSTLRFQNGRRVDNAGVTRNLSGDSQTLRRSGRPKIVNQPGSGPARQRLTDGPQPSPSI